MIFGLRKKVLAFSLVGLLLTFSNAFGALDEKILQDIDVAQKVDSQLPMDLVLLDDQGSPRSLKSFFGTKPLLIAPVYFSCPMLCNQFTNGFLRSLNALSLEVEKDFDVLLVSFDPADTAVEARAKKATLTAGYKAKANANGFQVVTGSKENIESLMDAIGFKYAFDPVSKHYAHASVFVVATPTGKLSKYFFGIDFNVRDLKFALMEASVNRIGSLTDRLLLFCYHYDPSQGKYGFAIQRVIRVAGVSTVLALFTFIGLALRRERPHV